MPFAPKRPCRESLCPELVDGGGFCSKHKRERQRFQDRDRGSASARGYDARWRRLRKLILDRDPICKTCDLHASEVVDHIIRREERPDLAYSPENLQGLCKPCHDRKTATQDDGFGRLGRQRL